MRTVPPIANYSKGIVELLTRRPRNGRHVSEGSRVSESEENSYSDRVTIPSHSPHTRVGLPGLSFTLLPLHLPSV